MSGANPSNRWINCEMSAVVIEGHVLSTCSSIISLLFAVDAPTKEEATRDMMNWTVGKEISSIGNDVVGDLFLVVLERLGAFCCKNTVHLHNALSPFRYDGITIWYHMHRPYYSIIV